MALLCLLFGFKGSRFTWARGRSVVMRVAKRLDHISVVLKVAMARGKFTLSSLSFIRPYSLLVKWKCDSFRRRFHFEASWLTHPTFKDLLLVSWDTNKTTLEAPNSFLINSRLGIVRFLGVLRRKSKNSFKKYRPSSP
ncbi:LOW QUALITY PROTEIN: hypothetical protein V2J09_022247 [Rumex salicifolius]